MKPTTTVKIEDLQAGCTFYDANPKHNYIKERKTTGKLEVIKGIGVFAEIHNPYREGEVDTFSLGDSNVDYGANRTPHNQHQLFHTKSDAELYIRVRRGFPTLHIDQVLEIMDQAKAVIENFDNLLFVMSLEIFNL